LPLWNVKSTFLLPRTRAFTLSNHRTKIWLLVAVLLSVLATAEAYQGVILGGDDVLYTRLASDMASGRPTFAINPHTSRLGFIAPLAGLYTLFGVHDWTTIAFPLFCTVASILAAAFGANRLYGAGSAPWAALLCGLNPTLYRHGSVGMPDVPAGFLYGLFTLAWILVIADRIRHRRTWAFLAGMSCGWAVATRESTAPMICLTVLGFLVLDRRASKLQRFPVIFFLIGAFLITIPYLFSFWYFTGNPFFFVDAAQKGFHVAGAPWLPPLEGWRFWIRMSGLSILRAAVEGYLFAVFPVIITLLLKQRFTLAENRNPTESYLLLATISPLLVLSHFSTSFTTWYPVHLDLRFGTPTIIPASILAAGGCIHLPSTKLPSRARVGVFLAVGVSLALLVLSLKEQNLWSMTGAAASVVAGAALLKINGQPKRLLPLVLVGLLTVSWLAYRLTEYPQFVERNTLLHPEGRAVPWDSSHPVLTDSVTGPYLSYLFGFSRELQLATWNGEQEPGPFLWTGQRDTPWPKPYLVVWYPRRAEVATGRWGGKVPGWVINELKGQELILELHDDSPANELVFDRLRDYTDEYQLWPKPGIYLILGKS